MQAPPSPAVDTQTSDPSYDLLSSSRQKLDAFFEPESVAVIGASETPQSVGRTLLLNLITSPFGGAVYPVNPKRDNVLGIKAYPSVRACPGKVDLAVIATPARTVPGVIAECVEAGARAAIIISAGFKEVGESGAELEEEVRKAADGKIRIIGPNCLGVMRPPQGLNATFASAPAGSGSVGFISQSGALLTSILDYSFRENIGFSAFISIGSMLDVDWGDLIYYLGDDPKTDSIVCYMESIGDARSFLSAAREVALRKPIIVIKAGRTQAAARAAASHTGSLAGSDAVLSAAFRRTGVLRVDSIADLFYMAETLAKQPRPKGPNLTIMTNAGGPGVLATDALVTGGGELAPLSGDVIKKLNAVLPPSWSHDNPIDMIGDAPPERYAKTLEIAAEDPNSDGLLVVLSPQAMTSPTATAELLTPYATKTGKPLLASWMGGASIMESEELLNAAGIPTFRYPDTAARMFNYMWRYSYNLEGLYETPSLPREDDLQRSEAEGVLEHVRGEDRTLLTEYESKKLLATYGIPTVDTRLAATPDEAVEQAEAIGYPVVLKLNSTTVTHKMDVGGVQLNLKNAQAVRDAFEKIREGVTEHANADAFMGVTVQPMLSLSNGYEVIVGSSMDSQFGPVMLFGTGGSLVEVYRDRALALPPLNTTLARRMMEQTKIYEALQGVRGRKPVDQEELEALMVRFSQLIVEQRAIKELDINPLFCSSDQIVALDARVVLHDAETDLAEVPRPAIRPYPLRYSGTWQPDGEAAELSIRPIRPEDEPLLVDFHERLSERSVYLRYASSLKMSQRVAHERLSRIAFIDYDRALALVAEDEDPETGERRIIAVGRLTKIPNTKEAEFAILVADEVQRQGLGTELLRRLVDYGRDEGLETITADILRQNQAMQRVSEKLGFEIVRPSDPDDDMVRAVKHL